MATTEEVLKQFASQAAASDALGSPFTATLCRVLAEMELAGCRVDKGALVSFGEMLSEKAGALEQDIYNMAGEEFNINSPK